jgi:L1 cell adhesion molecule like protein
MTKDNNLLGKFTLDGIPPMPRGVPQIEVTFDVDANGILNVSAAEKSTGKSHKITITNDKSRLSKEDIERLVADAEKFAAQDKERMEIVEARNKLEAYLYNVRSSLKEDKLKTALGDDATAAEKAVEEGITWLGMNDSASKQEYEEQFNKYEEQFKPLFMKAYQSADPVKSDSSSAPDSSEPRGPKVEEVD